METVRATVASMPFPREPANYDEVSMQQSMLFSDSLKGFTSSRSLLAVEGTPVSSPLLPALPSSTGTGSTETQRPITKPDKVQAVLKGIKQSPKKVNLVAALVRGMLVVDALLQLQMTVKRAAKTVYQVESLFFLPNQNQFKFRDFSDP